MKISRIFKIFRRFHGSGRYAAKRLSVLEPTKRLGAFEASVSMWINGERPVPQKYMAALSAVAAEIERTDGACIKDTVRQALPKLRKGR